MMGERTMDRTASYSPAEWAAYRRGIQDAMGAASRVDIEAFSRERQQVLYAGAVAARQMIVHTLATRWVWVGNQAKAAASAEPPSA